MAGRLSRSVQPILAAALAATALAPSRIESAVIVVTNRSDRTVQFALAPTWAGNSRFSLAPTRVISVQAPDAVQVTFTSGEATIRRRLEPNTLHEFYTQGEQIEVRPVLFSVGPSTSPPAGGPPSPVVVPVKLLGDQSSPVARAAWERDLRGQVEVASRYLELYCGVRFEVATVETWRPESHAKEPSRRAEELSRIKPQPAWLAIGLSNGMEPGAAPEAHHESRPLFSHLLLPDTQKDISAQDQLKLLIHGLGHFLGAVHSPEQGSVMRPGPLRGLGDSFDAVNTLVMNLFAAELRSHGPRAMEEMPHGSREYLAAIYREMATRLPADREIVKYAELVREPILPDARYLGQWTDGTRLSGNSVTGWHDAKGSPRLASRELFDPQRPLRWLLDNSLPPPASPESWIEFVGGDRLPGRVVGYNDGAESPRERLAPHLIVVPYGPLDLPDTPARAHARVSLPWLRRIVWQRVAESYQPRTLFFPDGRRLEFRSLRFSGTAVQLLRDEGVREVPLADAAELHLAPRDPWDAYFEQLAALAPVENARLVRMETVSGLRATSTTERFQVRGAADRPTTWHHLVQPAWSLDPFWLAHEAIRVREYFRPNEVPLSRIDPSRSRQQSDLGGVWRWQLDRNVEGGPMESGGAPSPWGFGVHARSELEFPLPAAARAFQTRLGLDQIAGNGGCLRASVAVDFPSGKTLFKSALLIGSGQTVDTGRLPLDGKPSRLLLFVDPASREGPPGADPLDIRDLFDWLEPMVELDPAKVDADLASRAARLIPAWQSWRVTPGDASSVRLTTYRDEQTPPGFAYRLLVSPASGGGRLSVSAKLTPRPYKDRLLISVSRPPQTASQSKLEVRVAGQTVGQFEIPVRYGAEAQPIVVSLSEHHGEPVLVELIHQPSDGKSLVEWRAISLVGRTAVP